MKNEIKIEDNKKMLAEFLKEVAIKNGFQGKYLQNAMKNITSEEVKKLESLLQFYVLRGLNLKEIVDNYLYLIDSIMEEQKYFIKNKQYRNSTYKEVEHLYKNSTYMSAYIIGFGLSTYLWDIHREMMRFFIIQCKNIKPGGTYLEIGCGHGEYFVTAMENTKFDDYLAVDISQTSVNMARDFLVYSLGDDHKNYEILHKDFFDFDSNKKFDALIMGEVLEHVENPLQFLEKIQDLAKDDAFIYITTAINAPQPDHIYWFKNSDEVLDLFHQANFDVVDQIAIAANNVSLEKAIKRNATIIVGFVLKKKKML